MAKMSVVVRAIRPADQKLGRLESRLINGLTIAVSIFVIVLVIVVIVISNWGETVVLTGSVTIENWVYDDDLGNPQSALYTQKSTVFCNHVAQVYIDAEKCSYFRGCNVLGYREGSVVVDFKITIASSLVEKDKDIMEMSEILILALLKKPGASQAFSEYSFDEYKIRLPGLEKHMDEQAERLPTDTDICTAWQLKLDDKTKSSTDKQCQAGWLRYKNSCYYIYTNRQVYRTFAENYCTGAQGHLVFIESEEEHKFIDEVVTDLHFTYNFFWFGAIRDPVTTRFKWVDYSKVNGRETVTPMCYRIWQLGQPNNYGGKENYVALINHKWDDVIGYPKDFYFICEKDLLANDKVWLPPDWSSAKLTPSTIRIRNDWPAHVTLSWNDYMWNTGRQDGVYVLVYYENEKYPLDRGFVTSGDTSVTVPKLTASSLYKMAFQWIRYKVAGQTSSWYDLQLVATTVSEMGMSPTNISTYMTKNDDLFLSWDIPGEIADDVTGYSVNLWHDEVQPKRTILTKDHSINVTSVNPGMRYYVQVQAKTETRVYLSPLSVYRIPNGLDHVKNARLMRLCGTSDVIGSIIRMSSSDYPNGTIDNNTLTSDPFNDTAINTTDFTNATGVNSTTMPTPPATTTKPMVDIVIPTENLPIDCEDSTCKITTLIKPQNGPSVEVVCDNGWLVIHRIGSNGTSFDNRTWNDYKNGFGSLESEFWIGNDNIYRFTNQMRYKLQIEFHGSDDVIRSATYDSFLIENESNLYRIHLDRFRGDTTLDVSQITQLRTLENGRVFVAKEGPSNSSCPTLTDSGWWFNSECDNFLTGRITGSFNISRIIMKIRRNN